MRLRYTPAALRDLTEIRDYISAVLRNPVAAKNVAAMILDSCAVLKQFPEAGISLAARTGLETDLRLLVCRQYVVLYRVEPEAVSVARILHGKQDHVRVILEE